MLFLTHTINPIHPDIRCKIITDTPGFKMSSQVTVGQCSTEKVTLS